MTDSETAGKGAAREGGDEAVVGGASSRRCFIRLAGGAGGAAALSGLLAACGSGAEEGGEATEETGPPEPATDLEIVNYALFLEYLEEDFYQQVIDSREIEDARLQRLTREIRQNEREHVQALTALARQLGGAPVPRPRSTFEQVVDAGEQRILEVASTLENLGAAAYLGQVASIENLQILETALSIHTVEARHAAALNEVAGNGFTGASALDGSIPDGAFAQPMTREEVLEATAPYIEV